MSAKSLDSALLSREELEALLADVGQQGAGDEHLSSRPFLGRPGAERPPRLIPLLRALEQFGEEQSRALSTLYQTPIQFSLGAWEELRARDLVATLPERDRVVPLDLSPGGQRAAVVASRSLLFGWMALAFGARPGALAVAPPEREFTRVEERFLRRIATEIAAELQRNLPPEQRFEFTARGVTEPATLLELGSANHLLASFDVSGLGELCRLRVMLPACFFEAQATRRAPGARASKASPTRPVLLEAALEARVEAGSAMLPLSRVASLQPGDLIHLEPADAGGLLVRIEGRPKFRAEPGAVGERLAVRITEPLGAAA